MVTAIDTNLRNKMKLTGRYKGKESLYVMLKRGKRVNGLVKSLQVGLTGGICIDLVSGV